MWLYNSFGISASHLNGDLWLTSADQIKIVLEYKLLLSLLEMGAQSQCWMWM